MRSLTRSLSSVIRDCEKDEEGIPALEDDEEGMPALLDGASDDGYMVTMPTANSR